MIVRFLTGPYRIAKAGGSSTTASTNTMRRGAYRGPWMFETVVRETIVDIAARRLGLDPLELRRRNLIQPSELPYTTAAGIDLDLITPAETLEQAVDLIGYDEFRRAQAAARADGSSARHRHRVLRRADCERVRHSGSPRRPPSASTSAARCRSSPA